MGASARFGRGACRLLLICCYMATKLMACRQENVDMKAEPSAVKDGNALACWEPLTDQVEASKSKLPPAGSAPKTLDLAAASGA